MSHKTGTDGEEVIVRWVVHPEALQADRIKALRGIWSGKESETDALIAERRQERKREERKAPGRGVGRL
jgi:hypothetical protein